MPTSYVGLAIAAIVVFFPLGIPALVNARRAERAWLTGDEVGARKASRRAKTYGFIAVAGIGTLAMFAFILFAMPERLTCPEGTPTPQPTLTSDANCP